MRAIVQDTYGAPDEVLELRELELPEMADDEVLVRVRAAAVAGDDWHLMRGLPYVARLTTGMRAPKHRVPGTDLAGRVEAVGRDVTRFEPGDEVFGWSAGAFAEYATVPEQALLRKPESLTLEEAAAIPGSALTALQALRDKGGVTPGHDVLVIGASGGVGSFAVQLGKALGATVTGVCSTANVDLVRSLGADRVVDYVREDFAAAGPAYDVIVDLVGDRTLKDLRRALREDGTLVMVGGTGGRWFKGTDRWLRAMIVSPFVGQRLVPLVHADRPEDLADVREFVEAGELKPLLSARYPLSRVTEAIRHTEGRHGRGKVVVTMP